MFMCGSVVIIFWSNVRALGSVINAAAARALALGFDAAHVAPGRAIELPGVKFFNGGVSISECAVGDTHEFQRAIQVLAIGPATDIQIALVGQRNFADAGTVTVAFAIHVER